MEHQLPFAALARSAHRLALAHRYHLTRSGFVPSVSSLLKKRPVGVEPTHPPWKDSRLPLHHGRKIYHL